MKYSVNPHQQVVIALYENGTFLQHDHQEMLRERRNTNPNDILYFVYDSQLFKGASRNQEQNLLEQFCNECQLIPYDIHKEIRELVHTTDFSMDEKKLFQHYEDEIASLEEGASLESASRFIRWFNKILRLGIYTNIDVIVNTHGLPSNFVLNQPMLVNVPSDLRPSTEVENNLPKSMENISTMSIASSDIIILSYSHEEEARSIVQSMQAALCIENLSAPLFYETIYRDLGSKSLERYDLAQRFISPPRTHTSENTLIPKPLSLLSTELDSSPQLLRPSRKISLKEYREINEENNAEISSYTYTLNPHSHVKIWLSKHPSLFMNLENQLRLIQMRDDNLRDSIHLVYDSQLLNPEAQDALMSFCQQYRVDAQDIRALMQSQSKKYSSREEKKLWGAYQDEITALQSGGNLGAASDLLRILEPVCSLGVYSDFDVSVKTAHLPATIETNSAILLNLGSVVISSDYGTFEETVLNNDVFAVTHTNTGDLSGIQEATLKAYQMFDYDAIGRRPEDVMKAQLLQRLSSFQSSALKMRQAIMSATSTNKNFLSALQVESHAMAQGYRAKVRETFEKIPDMAYREAKLAELEEESDDSIITKQRQIAQCEMLKLQVMFSSGAAGLKHQTIPSNLSQTDFQKAVKPMSLEYYGLRQAFLTDNSYVLGMDENDLGQESKNIFESKFLSNDLSWTQQGATMQRQRDDILHHVARINCVDLSQTLPPRQAEELLKCKDKIVRIWEKISEIVCVETHTIRRENRDVTEAGTKESFIHHVSKWLSEDALDLLQLPALLSHPWCHNVLSDDDPLIKTLQTLQEIVTIPSLQTLHDILKQAAEEIDDCISGYLIEHPEASQEDMSRLLDQLVQEKIGPFVRADMAEYRLQQKDQDATQLQNIKDSITQRWTSVVTSQLEDVPSLTERKHKGHQGL